MKKNTKRIIAIFFACMIMLTLSVPAFAAGTNHFPYSSANRLNTNSSDWKTIAYSDNGFSCKVYIQSNRNSSIRMLDGSGNIVWQEVGCQPATGYRIYDCGSNVYTIQIKNQTGTGYAWASYYSEL